jgi:hypothetical protein
MEPHEALNDNKVYKVVWQVLQALRSHDDRFDAMINKLDLIGRHRKMEVIAITDKAEKRPKSQGHRQSKAGKGEVRHRHPGSTMPKGKPTQAELQFEGRRNRNAPSTPRSSKNVATAATGKTGPTTSPRSPAPTSTASPIVWRIRPTPERRLPSTPSPRTARRPQRQHHRCRDHRDARPAPHHQAGLRRPVRGLQLRQPQPVSQAMQACWMSCTNTASKRKPTPWRNSTPASQRARRRHRRRRGQAEDRRRALRQVLPQCLPQDDRAPGHRLHPGGGRGLHHPQRQRPAATEFGQTLGSKGVHIIDPFTGTGTFITRLLQSGLIKPEELPHKYKHEIHANEIVLLAYYIAAINIEAVYHGIVRRRLRALRGHLPHRHLPDLRKSLAEEFSVLPVNLC